MRRTLLIFPITIIYIFMSCGNKNDINQPHQHIDTVRSANLSESDNAIMSKENKIVQNNNDAQKKYEFTFQNDTVIQILKLEYINKDTIYFDLKYKYNKYDYQITNLAVLKKYTFDGESILTDNGELFFVKEYVSTFENRPLVISVEENFKLALVSIHDELGVTNDIFRDDFVMYLK